ncbi:ranBP2-like and GRIP domain-containing protein 3 [Chelonus insularis]|uniref:ranBP2-like and GRIP domain-containing protein 3 n=1 Tax=Chelonus insularis TaxID=460826 RepID=UPI00158BF48A|nr:ranBP2-like and GRIP domain-containing protein 3 [Chelonus insularis]
MFQSKVSVDRHRDEVFRKIRDERERSLRCYSIAKLYFQVEQYELARKYVSEYLKIKEDSAPAHKLLGQSYEALGQKELALEEYRQSLQLDGRQDDLILKVCELLVDESISADSSKIQYWVERAVEKYPDHPVVFKLKEKMITNNGSGDNDLEGLINSEISVRPTDVNLRVKLIKYYISKRRIEDAYKHAVEVECTYTHHQSLTWYECVYDLLTKMKECKNLKWSFWVFLVTASERYAALSLSEYGGKAKNVPEAMQILLNFDQVLFEAKSKIDDAQDTNLALQMFNHMWGQFNYHLGCLWLRLAKKEITTWRETVRLCCPLFLTAIHSTVIDPEASWGFTMKGQASLWHKEGSYRCSQAGHVLTEYCRNRSLRLMDKISECMTDSWREKIFRKIFAGRYSEKIIKTSYFVNNTAINPPLRLLSPTELEEFDKVAKQIYPDSLHHLVWLGVLNKNMKKETDKEPCPNEHTTVFPGLQYSVHNLTVASAESLSILDLDVFLNSTILCSLKDTNDQAKSGLLNPDRMLILPADLTDSLCSTVQAKWWSSAYKIHNKRHELIGDMTELRMEIQKGLEIIRCIRTNGLHYNILIHLGRMFTYRGKHLQEVSENHPNSRFILDRAELYWSMAIPLIKSLLKKHLVRMMPDSIFNYTEKEPNHAELRKALEEGQLVIAEKHIGEKNYEHALVLLQELKSPDASFYQGEVYELLAEELIQPYTDDTMPAGIKDQYSIMLIKAKNCYYLTLDRLRCPSTNPGHPLNAEINTKIANVEDLIFKVSNENEIDENHDVSGLMNHSVSTINVVTPLKKNRVTPRRLSSEMNSTRLSQVGVQEARPSPERIDAQIRQVIYDIHNMNHTVLDLVNSFKTMNDSIVQNFMKIKEEWKKDFAEFRQEFVSKRKVASPSRNNLDDETYIYEEDYNVTPVTPAAPTIPTQHIPGGIFPPRPSYSSLVYPTPPQHGAYYQGLPYTDYTQQSLQSFYPNVYQIPPLYPRANEQALGVPRMQEMLQQGMITSNLFNSRSMPVFSDLVSPKQQPQMQANISSQSLDLTRNTGATVPLVPPTIPVVSMPTTTITGMMPTTIQPPVTTTIKNTLVNKSPPVNVVITSSDTLPTSAPSVQPVLSVVIPPHHRNVSSTGGAGVPVTNIQPIVTTSAPHNYQILMPSQAAVPTTVNIPSIFNPVTNTIASKSPTVVDKNASVVSNTSHNSSIDAEVEHDPIPDFMPVIPLPAEVKVTTGEEDEEELFCARAKLFRFVDKEWKERGVGNVKLLKNNEGKVRLLMRRDQVLKICANHNLTPDMELSAMSNNDKAWIWAANDYADEEIKLEKLCIKFKLVEEAQSFKEHFDKAKKSVPVVVKDATESKKVEKTSQEAEKPEAKGSFKMGGFSFSSKPMVQTPPSTDSVPKKAEEPSAPSPFASFSFNKTVEPVGASTPFNAIGKTTADVKSSTIDSTITTSASTNSVDSSSAKQPLRRPYSISSSSPSDTEAIGGVLGDNDEAVLFETTTSLISSIEASQWKNRGIGSLMLILDTKTGQLRLKFQQKDASKPLLNCVLPKNNIFKAGNKTPNVICWIWTESTASGKTENYAASFANVAIATDFLEKTTSLQKLMVDNKIPLENITKKHKTVSVATGNHQVASTTTTKPLSEMFKPAPGSWECGSCYTRNNAGVSNCVACTAPSATTSSTNDQPSTGQLFKPASDLSKAKSNSFGTSTFTFGIPKNSTSQDSAPTSTFVFGSSKPPAVSQPPSTDVNKVQTKPFSTTTSSSSLFSFGSDQTNTGLIFKPSTKQPESTKEGEKVDQSKQSKEFVFGNAQKIENPPSTFNFGNPGSPRMTFGYQWPSKSPPKALDTSAVSEVSEDEVAESEDVYFPPVIPLPDKIEVKTGEEDETVLYQHRAKLFRYDPNTKEWKERGLGDIKLLKHQETSKLRLVMRREQTLKLCLNHFVTKELEISPKDDKSWVWHAADYSDGEIEYIQLACRFKTSEIAEEFKSAVDNAIANIDVDASVKVDKTESPEDLQVVYELTVSPEEKAEALKLKLPENFYSYKQKKDCPGCLGCREPEVPLFDGPKESKTITTPSASIKLAPPKLNTSSLSITTASSNTSTGFSTLFKTTTATPATTAITTAAFASTSTSENVFGQAAAKPFSFGSTIFGGQPTSNSFSFSTPTTTSTSTDKNFIFGGSNLGNLTICSPSTTVDFGKSDAFTKNAAGSAISWFGNAQKTTEASKPSIFGGSMSTSSTASSFKNEGFLNTDNIATFSSLAAKAGEPVEFKTDPNFVFAGAGQSVFGSAKPPVKNTPDKKQNEVKTTEEEETEEKGGDDEEEYDPHYEPIIPLPDAIEVKTGEEDEEKVFCHRAKLYRYEDETKEWKERGVGEMKVLYHAGQGTYRLLLRREQVHKIVCNFLITADLDMQTLTASDRSWMWAGMNYVDNEHVAEKLAVKFKNLTIANEFKTAVENAKLYLKKKTETNNETQDWSNYESASLTNDPSYDDNGADEIEEDESSFMFDRPGALFYLEGDSWVFDKNGQARIVYDHDLFGARIMFVTDSGEVISHCFITTESLCQREKNECLWTAVDEAVNPPRKRQLKVTFSNEEYAEEMFTNFLEGIDCARHAGISETNFIYTEDRDEYK